MKRALISVYDKTGIVEFAKGLSDLDWEIISTGGTYTLLKENEIEVIAVEDITKSPEILDGRVKTLHPSIHGGILFKRDNEDHVKTIEDMDIKSIDMVVNNLYPFEETIKKVRSTHEEIIENIDIGGPSMIRAAAKNYEDVIIVTDPKDYEDVLTDIANGDVTLRKREKLAAKAFRTTAYYDSLIAEYFNEITEAKFPEYFVKGYSFSGELRYGENPHQEACYYQSPLGEDFVMEKLHGKEISYNNYNDIYNTINIIKEFEETACVAVKHTNPCGVAVGDSPADAYQKAYECDPVSIYGGIVAFNREVDKMAAEKLHELFLEVVIAPDFTDEALDILEQKENIRLVRVENLEEFEGKEIAIKETVGGLLVQEADNKLFSDEGLKIVAGHRATAEEMENLEFAWKVVKHCTSNAITIAKDGRCIGIGNGEVRRVWALENALNRSEFSLDGAVAASDGFFFEDTIETLHKYGIKAVIQPGGSIHDEKVIEAANEYGITVIFTGMRHFKH